MKSQEKRNKRLKQVLDDYREQTQFRKMLKDKPKEIIDYEKRLKAATFAYSKADDKSQKGRSRTAKKMFGASDTLFERLAEYLSEKIVGHHHLEAWFDRTVETTPENSFGLSPDSFPQIITSKSLKNTGGGYVNSLRTIREVKVDAVEAVLAELSTLEQETVVDEIANMARLKKLMKRSRD